MDRSEFEEKLLAKRSEIVKHEIDEFKESFDKILVRNKYAKEAIEKAVYGGDIASLYAIRDLIREYESLRKDACKMCEVLIDGEGVKVGRYMTCGSDVCKHSALIHNGHMEEFIKNFSDVIDREGENKNATHR